jgi:hypothetical protein
MFASGHLFSMAADYSPRRTGFLQFLDLSSNSLQIDRLLEVVSIAKLPLHPQVLTPGIFHPNRCAVRTPVFYLNNNATLQTHATRVFNLKQPAIERADAARVFH